VSLSRNSAAGMQVRPGPGGLADVELVTLEGALESFALTAFFAGCGVFSGDFFEVIADHAGESGIAIDGDFAEFFDEFLVEREGDIHGPIIRETLKSCKWTACAGRPIRDPPSSPAERPIGLVPAGYWSGAMLRAECDSRHKRDVRRYAPSS